MIAEGKYPARGIEAALVTSKNKGTPGVQVIVEITEGDFAGERIRYDGWMTDETAQRVIESLRYLGWQGELLTDLTGITTNIVQIVVENEEREIEGEFKTFPRVRWINRLGGGAKIAEEAKVSGNAADALAQRFRAIARGVPAVAANAKPGASAPRAATGLPRSTLASGATTAKGGPPPHAADAPDFGDDNIPF